MSRSCKKTPVSKGRCKNFRWAKRAANKRVRRAKTLWGKSKAFRKISETWDICDWKFYGERSWNPNREEKNHWEKCYYISDLHLLHEHCICFDERPFGDLEKMHETMDEL